MRRRVTRSAVTALIAVALIAGTLLVFSPSHAQSVTHGTVVVNTSFLNIRSGPGSQFLVIGVAAGGTELPVTGITRDRTWWRVDSPYGEGFVFNEFVLYRGEGSTVPFVGTGAGAVSEPPTVIVLAQTLNVRSGPSINNPSLGSVPQKSVMTIIGQNVQTGWYLVNSPFGPGWVANDEVSLAGDTRIIPRVDASGALEPGAVAIPSTGITPGGGTGTFGAGGGTSLDQDLATFGFVPTNFRLTTTVSFPTLFVRARPYYGATIIGAAARGDTITIMGRDGEAIFVLVQAPTVTGWAPANGIHLDYDIFNIPVANANPQLSIEGKPSVPTGADISTGGAFYGFTTHADVIVHQRPQLESAAIGSLGAGVKTTIIGRDVDIGFYQINTPFGVGWIRNELDINLVDGLDPYHVPVTAANGIPFGAVTTPGTTTSGTTGGVIGSGGGTTTLSGPLVIVNTPNQNLRSGPGGQYTAIAVVVGGQQFRVTGQLSDSSWYRVDTPFGEGWLFAQYVVFRGDASSVPVIS